MNRNTSLLFRKIPTERSKFLFKEIKTKVFNNQRSHLSRWKSDGKYFLCPVSPVLLTSPSVAEGMLGREICPLQGNVLPTTPLSFLAHLLAEHMWDSTTSWFLQFHKDGWLGTRGHHNPCTIHQPWSWPPPPPILIFRFNTTHSALLKVFHVRPSPRTVTLQCGSVLLPPSPDGAERPKGLSSFLADWAQCLRQQELLKVQWNQVQINKKHYLNYSEPSYFPNMHCVLSV